MSLHLLLIVLVAAVVTALPDVVVRIAPPTLMSQSESLTTSNDDDKGPMEFLVKRAQFGSRNNLLNGTLILSPDYDMYLCENYYVHIDVDEYGNYSHATLPPFKKPEEDTVMLVPRGECSFERKAYAASAFYGAKAIIIYDRLAARYRWNETSEQVTYPRNMIDYECSNGYSIMNNLALDPPPYNETQLDPIMGMTTMTPTMAMAMATNNDGSTVGSDIDITGTTTVCNLTDTTLQQCESQLCLVATRVNNSDEYPVCCAWDTPVTMPSADDAKELDTDNIIAVWLTIRQSEIIFQSGLLSFGNEISIESRGSNSMFNGSYILMWLFGTLVMAIGAFYAAGNYRDFGAQFTAYKESEEGTQTNRYNERRRESDTDLERGEDIFRDEIRDENIGKDAPPTSRLGKEKDNEKAKKNKNPKEKKKQKQEVWSLHSLPPPERKNKKKKTAKRNDSSDNFGATQVATTTTTTTTTNSNPNGTNNIEEGTIIPARESGKVAFEMNHWHVLMFVVTASLTLILLYFFKSMYNIIFVIYGLGCARAVSHLIFSPLVGLAVKKLGKSWEEDLNKPLFCGVNGYSVTSSLIAYTWAAVWIWYGIKHYRPQTNAFFWLTLDIFGACVCILGVSVLKLNSIKIATILLVAIFFYDIFFVFITPFLTGGKSVMLDVASGSAPDPSEEDYCNKYPEDCQGIGFLPMIFIFPQINDYADGSTILGLGDIVLPGFLIAFCARHDEAARLIGVHSPENKGIIDVPTKWYEGYFFSMMVAYSSGLFFAFMAVILMEQGQPALLYICPVCLATIFYLGRKDWKDLWNGAKVFRIADKLISKTERKWGKERTKRFAEERKRENAPLGTSSGNEGDAKPHSRRRSLEPDTQISNNLSPTATKMDSKEDTQPVSKDVCFGYEGHPGTIAFRTVVEEVATDLGEEEYRPEIYKIIKKKLKGRRFFKNDDIIWAEATKFEARKEIGIAYDQARGRVSSVLEDFDPLSLPTL